jgi:hypothetical protein
MIRPHRELVRASLPVRVRRCAQIMYVITDVLETHQMTANTL